MLHTPSQSGEKFAPLCRPARTKSRILQGENDRCMEPIQFFLSACLMLALYWAAGSMLLPLLAEVQKLSSCVRFFLQLVLGFFGTTIIVALYYTSGYTVMALSLPAFGVILWLRRQEIRRISVKDFGLEWRHGAEALVALALLVLVQLYRNDYFNAEVVSAGAHDFGIYATVAEYLKISGIETSSPWYQLFEESADGLAKPYHYGDLWSLALLFDLSPAVPIDNYIYVWIPLINAVLFSGFAAVFRMVSGRQGWLGPVVAFMVLFLNMRIEAWDWSWAFGWNAIIVPKTIVFTSGMTLWFVAYREQVAHIDLLAIGLMMVSSILLIPILAIAFIIFYLVTEKRKIRITVIVALPLLIFIAYYLVDFAPKSFVWSDLRSYIFYFTKYMVAAVVKFTLFFLPVILCLLALYFYFNGLAVVGKRLIFIMLGISLSGAVSYALMNGNVEAFQLVSLIHTPMAQFGMVYGIALLMLSLMNAGVLHVGVKLMLSVLLIQMSWGVVNTFLFKHDKEVGYSHLFLNNTRQILQNKHQIGVSVIELGSYGTFQADPRMCYPCNFLKKIGSGYWANQISIPEDMSRLEFPERRTAIELSPFYRFNEQYKREAPHYTFEAAQTAFINKYEVDFIVIEKGARHPAWLANCTDTLLTDPVSGTILATLRRPCYVKPNSPTQ